MNRSIILLVVAAVCSFFTAASPAFAQGTAFTYQGQLQNNGGAISGTFNLTFSLYAANTGGSAIAGPVTTNGVVVTNGLFMVQMDFGAGPWNGQTNWLEIGVETNGGVSFTTLAPRQELTPTPYAIFANTASNLVGTLPVAQLSGIVPLAQLPTAVVTNNASGVDLSGAFGGNGGGLTNVPAYWQTVPGTSLAASANYNYLLTNNSLSTVTLPASANVGDIVSVSGTGSNGWQVVPGAGQSIPGAVIPAGLTWTLQSGSPSVNWACLASSADGSKLVGVVNGGQIYTSPDSGVTWTLQSGAPIEPWVSVASSADGSKLVAVAGGQAYTGQIYTSGDSGVTWTPQSSAPTVNWSSVASSTNGTQLVAVAISGQVYTSANSGANWTQQNGAPGLDWYSVASSADGTELVAASMGNPIYTSANSGVTWTAQNTPQSIQWSFVASSADGTKLLAIGGNRIYNSSDSGMTWTVENNAPSANWVSLACSADGSKAVAVTQFGRIYTSSDSGVTWTAQTSGSQQWASVASSSDGSKLVAALQNGQIYTSDASNVFVGAPGAQAQFQYLGNGVWEPLSQPASQLTGQISSAQLPANVVTEYESGVTLDGLTVYGMLTIMNPSGSGPDLISGNRGTILDGDQNGNIFLGLDSGNLTVSGFYNVGVGAFSLFDNTSGVYNTASGAAALQSNLTGDFNTADGADTLPYNTAGSYNTAVGANSLVLNQANNNTAVGYLSMYYNAVGSDNTAVGEGSLVLNGANYNTAVGSSSMYNNTNGTGNTAVGYNSLQASTNGSLNTAIGNSALANLASGSNNIALGHLAGDNFVGIESSNIDIGNQGVVGENQVIRIGDSQTQAYIAGVITGNGGGLTNLNASQLTGPISPANLPAGLITNNEAGVNLGTLVVTNLSVAGTNEIAPLTVPPNLSSSVVGTVAISAAGAMALAGRYAYAVGGSTLQVIDVTTATNPAVVGTLTGLNSPESVAVAGRYVYVANTLAYTLDIIDVSDPFNPVIVGSLNGGAAYAPTYVAVAGRYAYVTTEGHYLQIYDVSTPSNPVVVSTIDVVYPPAAIAVSGRYVYVVANSLQIFDVSNPASPVNVSFISMANTPWSLAVSGRYAYVGTLGDQSLHIFDVSNPASPVSVSVFNLGVLPYPPAVVVGRDLFVGGKIIDVNNPASPVFVGSAPAGCVSGRYDYAFGAGTLQVIDLGGAYIQQMEAGSIETGTLQTRDNATVGNSLDVRGGLTVSASARISGGLGADSITATSFTGNAAGLTNLNATQLSGVIPLAQLPAAAVTNNNSTSVTLTGAFSGNGAGLTNLPVPAPSGYTFVYDTPGGAVAAGTALPLASVGVTNGWALNTSTGTLTVSNAGPYLIQFEGWSTSATHNPVGVAVNGTPITGGGTFIVANAEFSHSFITSLAANATLQVVNLGGSTLTLSPPASGEPVFSVTITKIK